MTDKIIKEIIQTWTSTLEIEFKILNESVMNRQAVAAVKEVISKLTNSKNLKNAKIERSLNCIKTCNSGQNARGKNKVYQVIIGKTKQEKKIINKYTKDRLKTLYLDNMRIVLASEIPIDDVSYRADMCNMLRFRNRISIPVLGGKWRLDITLIKSINNVRWNMNILEEPIKYLLRVENLEVKNYADKAPWNYADTIEAELEYVGTSAPKKQDLLNAVKFIKKTFSFTQDGQKQETSDRISTGSDRPLEYLDALVKIAQAVQPKFVRRYSSGDWGIKKLSNAVITLDIDILYRKLIPEIDNYAVSPKIDGVRTLLLFLRGNCYALNNSIIILPFKAPNTRMFLFDSEMFEDENKDNQITFFIFDCLVYEGDTIMDKNYDERINYIDKLVESKLDKQLQKKPILLLTNKNWKKDIKSYLTKKWKYETDGLVFTPINNGYFRAKIYKWKPAKYMAIDFLYRDDTIYSGIKKRIANVLLANENYDSSLQEEYIPAKFQPTYLPFALAEGNLSKLPTLKLKGVSSPALVELTWDIKAAKWNLLLVRQDRQRAVDSGKYFGNDYKIADLIWHSIFWPILPKMLTSPVPPLQYKNHMLEVVEENIGYFSQIYSSVLSDNENVNKIIDAGTYYPCFNKYHDVSQTKAIDFLISDGFSCLTIINRKYDKRFYSSLNRKILISAYDPKSYNLDDNVSPSTLLMAIFPIRDQLLSINKLLDNTSVSKVFMIVHKNDIKLLKSKKIKQEKLSDVYSISDKFTGNVNSYYVLTM